MTSDIIMAVFVYPATIFESLHRCRFIFSHSKALILHSQRLKHIIASPLCCFKFITSANAEVRGSEMKSSLSYSELKTRRLNLSKILLKMRDGGTGEERGLPGTKHEVNPQCHTQKGLY